MHKICQLAKLFFASLVFGLRFRQLSLVLPRLTFALVSGPVGDTNESRGESVTQPARHFSASADQIPDLVKWKLRQRRRRRQRIRRRKRESGRVRILKLPDSLTKPIRMTDHATADLVSPFGPFLIKALSYPAMPCQPPAPRFPVRLCSVYCSLYTRRPKGGPRVF